MFLNYRVEVKVIGEFTIPDLWKKRRDGAKDKRR